jgi:hypothetical protein
MTLGSSANEDTADQGQDVVKNDVVETSVSQDAPVTEKTEKPSTSESSDAKKPSSALDAAKAALGMPAAADSSTGSGTDQQKPPKASDGEDKTPSADKGDHADKDPPPFHNHPRWKEVTKRNRELETANGALTDKAKRWDAIDGQFQASGLSAEDVEPLFTGASRLKAAGASQQELSNLMAVGAALKIGDRALVLQFAQPVFAQLGLEIVESLPEDLRRQVDEGAMTEDAAKQVVSSRIAAQSESYKRRLAEKRVAQRDESDGAQVLSTRILSATGAWEERKSKSDADWGQKQASVVEAIVSRLRVAPPKTEEEALEICEQAYEQVSRIFKAAGGPTRRPVIAPVGGGSPHNAVPAPKSPLEAAKLALARGG